jgi:hypothetical protein
MSWLIKIVDPGAVGIGVVGPAAAGVNKIVVFIEADHPTEGVGVFCLRGGGLRIHVVVFALAKTQQGNACHE